jgi:hypothetical protein
MKLFFLHIYHLIPYNGENKYIYKNNKILNVYYYAMLD